MLNLPPPQTFNDGERKKYGILMSVAGICYGLAAIAAASVIVFGEWPEGLARIRLYLVGAGMALASVGSILVTIALAVGGPVGRVKARGDRQGFEIEAEGDAN
jgi:hypothetical protein